MTRGKFILIIITICAIIGFGGYYVYKKYTTQQTPTTNTTGVKDFTLFDSIFNSNNNTTNTNNNTNGSIDQNPGTQIQKLHQISYRPVAGYGLFTKGVERLVSESLVQGKPKTTTDYVPVVRYTDQETGIVYEQDSKHTEIRLTNTTIPNTYEALFSSDGVHILFRFLDTDQQTILTYVASLAPKTTAPTDLTGYFTYQNIKNIQISTDGNSFVYTRPKPVGVDVVTTLFNNKKDTLLFSSPISEWVVDSINKSTILTTKPTGLFDGYSYTIENTTLAYSKTLSGRGLTQKTTNDGLYKIYSTTNTGTPNIFILNTKNNNIYDTGIKTLSEKCVYNLNMYYCAVPANIQTSTYPDTWYQGTTTFNDDLWVIEPATQKLTYIEHLKTNVDGIDATNLQIDSTGKRIYFTDKKTSLLWAFDL